MRSCWIISRCALVIGNVFFRGRIFLDCNLKLKQKNHLQLAKPRIRFPTQDWPAESLKQMITDKKRYRNRYFFLLARGRRLNKNISTQKKMSRYVCKKKKKQCVTFEKKKIITLKKISNLTFSAPYKSWKLVGHGIQIRITEINENINCQIKTMAFSASVKAGMFVMRIWLRTQ